MTRAITITGFLAVLAVGVWMGLRSRQPGSRLPAVGDVLGHVMRQRSGRVMAFIVWFWFGWHFLAR